MGKSLKLETILMLYVIYTLPLSCYILKGGNCVCLREKGHNSSFDSCINGDMGSSFFVYNSKLVQFEDT